MAAKDWTLIPANFVDPETGPEQQERWGAAWMELYGAFIGLFAEEDREQARALIDSGAPFDAPRGWARELEKTLVRTLDRSRPTIERILAGAEQLYRAATALREQAETDPEYFPSPVGQALLRVFDQAMFYSLQGGSGDHSIPKTLQAVVWPALSATFPSLSVLVLPSIARQLGQVQFEVWADRFRRVLTEYLEGFYRPLVSAFYRLSRLPPEGRIQNEVTLLGRLFRDAQAHWAGSPLSLLVDGRIAVVRNSEAHNHTVVDVDAQRFTFISKDPGGVEKGRWTATPADVQRLAVHVYHLGDVMKTVLLAVPLRTAGPLELLGVIWAMGGPDLVG